MFFKRTDVNRYVRCSLGELAAALDAVRARYGDAAQIQPNDIGNLAVLTPPGELVDRSPAPNGLGVMYAGYIDLAMGDLVWEMDESAVNCPWSDRSGVAKKVDGGRLSDQEVDRVVNVVAQRFDEALDRGVAKGLFGGNDGRN